MVLARTIPTTFWVTSLRTNKSALFEFTIWWELFFHQHCQCFNFSKCMPGANVMSVSLNIFVPAGTTSNACNTYEGSSARSNFPSQNHSKFKAVWLLDFFHKQTVSDFVSLSFFLEAFVRRLGQQTRSMPCRSLWLHQCPEDSQGFQRLDDSRFRPALVTHNSRELWSQIPCPVAPALPCCTQARAYGTRLEHAYLNILSLEEWCSIFWRNETPNAILLYPIRM